MTSWQEMLAEMRVGGKEVPDPATLAKQLAEARKAGIEVLRKAAADIERYLSLVSEGKLTGEDLGHLLKGVRAQLRAEAAVAKAKARSTLRGFLTQVVTVLLNQLAKSI
jgi:hypothetical protein